MAVTLPEPTLLESPFMKTKEMQELHVDSFVDLRICAKTFRRVEDLNMFFSDVSNDILESSIDNIVGCSSSRAASRY